MGFWDRLKALITGGDPPPPAAPASALARRIEAIVVRRMTNEEPFEAILVAGEALTEPAERTVQGFAAACAIVEALHAQGRFAPFGYVRTKLADGNWLYHPPGYDVASYRVTPAAVAPPRSTAPTPPPAAPSRVKAPVRNPYEAADGILGLSAAELRTRALRIDPYRTAWIGRVDTIPPQSDERTALIDRGLILRGLLSAPSSPRSTASGTSGCATTRPPSSRPPSPPLRPIAKAADLAAARAAKKAEKKRASAERARLRAEAVLRRRQEDIVYLGAGVSRALADRRAHVEDLARRGLPVLAEPADVARAMGIPVPELRWLCFHAEAMDHPHYAYFEIPKRSGGKRLLAAPQPRLAAAQAWVLHEVLEKLPTEPPAHGFIKGRSTLTLRHPPRRQGAGGQPRPLRLLPHHHLPPGARRLRRASATRPRWPPSSRCSAPRRRAAPSISRASAPGPRSARAPSRRARAPAPPSPTRSPRSSTAASPA